MLEAKKKNWAYDVTKTDQRIKLNIKFTLLIILLVIFPRRSLGGVL